MKLQAHTAMKSKRTILIAVCALTLVAVALALPAVVAATSAETSPAPASGPAMSIAYTNQPNCYTSQPNFFFTSAYVVEESDIGEPTAQVFGCIERGTFAGLAYTSTEHPGGGPQLWCLCVKDDPSGRGEVVEFWVWVKVLMEPFGTSDESDLPAEFPLKVRLIDGGSPQADDWVQLFAIGSVPLLEAEPGCEECRLPAGGVEINWSPTF